MVSCRVMFLGVACLLPSCLLSAADPVPKSAQQIVGRWQAESPFTIKSNRPGVKDEVFTRKTWVEFRKDGTVTVTRGEIPELKPRLPETAKGSRFTGKYSFVSGAEIEVTVEVDGKMVTSRAKVVVTKDELSLAFGTAGKEEPPERFKRAKE